jgi:hypothetical protein
MKRAMRNGGLILGLTLLLTSCGESRDAAFQRGVSDGYATGFNDGCAQRFTVIDGDFDNPHYAEGYEAGYREGATDCAATRTP